MTGQSSLVTYTKGFFAQPIVKARKHNKAIRKRRGTIIVPQQERSGAYLNIKFNEIDRELSGVVEGANGVFFDGFHSVIRRLQHVHSAASVSHHHELGPFESAFGFYAFIMFIHTYAQNPKPFISFHFISKAKYLID